MHLELIKCPICGSKEYKNITIGKEYLYTREFGCFGPKAVRCLECSLIYLNPILSDEDYNVFYDKEGQSEFIKGIGINIGGSTDTPKYRLDIVRKYSKDKKILDIGTGRSKFLLDMVGCCKSSYGLDTSKKRSERQDIKIINENILYWNTRDRFDVITAFHVLEHIKYPHKAMNKISSLLNEDGIFIVEVPVIQDILFGLTSFKRFYIQAAHCLYFDEKTLGNLLKHNGFNIMQKIRIQRYSLSNHLHWLLFRKSGKIQIPKIINRLYSCIIRLLGFNDVIIYVCRKKND